MKEMSTESEQILDSDDEEDERSVHIVPKEVCTVTKNNIQSSNIDWQRYYSMIIPGFFLMYSGKPMSFFFRVEDEETKAMWEDLVVKGSGHCVESFLEMNCRTALMVPDECRTMLYSKPSFKTSYITDCIEQNTLLDISDYIHNSYFPKSDRYMKVIFYGTEKFKMTDDSSANKVNDDSSKNKRTKMLFSYQEKEAILKFIILMKKTTGLSSDTIWKAMERKNICPHRTYQSMKNHFRRTLINELDRFEFLSEKDKKMLRLGFYKE